MKQPTSHSIKKFILLLLSVEVAIWALLFLVYFFVMPAISTLGLQRPKFIWINLGLTVLSGLFLLLYLYKEKKLKQFSDPHLLKKISPNRSTALNFLKYILLRVALFALVVALINPRYGSKEVEAKNTGIDLIIALDVSNSMLAEDIQPNRLQRSKMAIEQLLNNLHGDRFGLVVFAGNAYVQLPVTTDISAAKIFLADVDHNFVPTQGTAIGAAIDLAADSFDKESTSGKAIVVITDGENHEDDAVVAAKEASDKGIRVYTIGMGSVNGAPIPEYNRSRKIGFKKDKEGSTVISKLNENALREISDAGEGKFTRATVSDVGLDLIFEDMESMDKNEFGTVQYADYEDRFQIFLLFSILLLILESIIPNRKLSWSKNVNLFE